MAITLAMYKEVVVQGGYFTRKGNKKLVSGIHVKRGGIMMWKLYMNR